MPQAKKRILFLERQASGSVSIERVFAEIASHLPDEYDVEFQKLEYGNGVVGILKNLLTFRKRPADIYHITGHIHYMSLVLPADRTVLTIHDLVFLHNRTGIRRSILKKLFLDWPLRKLRFVTTISESTKSEIGRYCDDSQVRVIENPLFEGFEAGDVKPFAADCPVILQIGTTDNKNVVSLIKAVAGSNCKLRIIGQLNDNIINELKANGTNYENVESVGDNEIIAEYRNADIVSFCSTYEGFGLPIIEAQAMGKPVITSDLAPMNAVAGSGALLVDPFDVSSIRVGIRRLIDDAAFREELFALGAENVKRFEPKRIAKQYADLYDEILAKRA